MKPIGHIDRIGGGLFLPFLLLLLALGSDAQDRGSAYYPDRFYVRLSPELSPAAVTDSVEALVEQVAPSSDLMSCEDPVRLDAASLKGIRELRFENSPDASSFIGTLEAHASVLYAERVPHYRFFYTPNDLQGTQWSLPKVNAEQAWNIEQGVDSIDDEAGTYSVYASNRCGSGTDTVEVKTEDCSCQFTIPNVFTPDGDGRNDRFSVESEHCGVKVMRIYNRWGQLLYKQENVKPFWDGRNSSGKEVPEGTYLYSIKIGEETYQGQVTLMRD